MKRTRPQCHPNRAHYAKGLCASCYHVKKQKEKTKAARVTHTHEVVRQVKQERTEKMAEKEAKAQDSVAGYSGSAQEGKKIERPKDASEDAVVSEAGVTEPTQVFGGDGVTKLAEWDEKQVERRKKQAEHDEKRRKQAVEDAGVIQTTEKHAHGR